VVWNEAQAGEARTLHGVPEDRIIITGAQTFDRWFAMRPSRPREDFCRRVGLDPARPYLLYTGSSVFIALEEVPFAERWLLALRESGIPRLAELGALFRPHPANARQWHAFDIASFPDAAIWPPVGTDPNSPGFKEDFFDSVYYSDGVVGINTSAQIEASIIGRPVFTVRSPEFAHGQEGTLHFRHLVDERGVVREAASLNEHVGQLSEVLDDSAPFVRNDAFLKWFVRPAGIDRPATPIFASAIESLLRKPRPAPRPEPSLRRAARVPVFLAARSALALAEGRPLWVYILRPPMTLAVHVAAALYNARDRWNDDIRLPFKRVRRSAWRAWYESSQRFGHRWHRWKKRLLRIARGARGTARRFVSMR
jgi:hypothetical protein